MKRAVKVVKEIEYEIEIDDKLICQDFVDSFERSFWELDGDTFEEKTDELFKVVAGQLMQGEERFIKGVGPCASVRTVTLWRNEGKEIPVVWDDVYDDIEMEIVE